MVKKMKKVISVLFLFVFMISTLSVDVHADVRYGGFFSKTSKNCGLLYYFFPPIGKLEINGYGYMQIGNYPWAQFGNEVKSIVIIGGVKSIAKHAFSCCPNLESVTVATDSLDFVDSCAFWNNMKLRTVRFEKNVGKFGNNAFNSCPNISHFDYLGMIPPMFDGGPITGPKNLEVNVHPDYSGESFGGVPIKRLRSEYEMENPTVKHCFFLDPDTPDAGKLIIHGEGIIPPSFEIIDRFGLRRKIIAPWKEVKEKVKDLEIQDGITLIGTKAFSGFKNLSTVYLPRGMKRIDYQVFKNCSSLKFINFPDSLKVIGDGAFANCSSLEFINFPDSLEYIADGAFANCIKLTTIDLPSDILIAKEAFTGCYSLSTVRYHGKKELPRISKQVFETCPNLKIVQVPVNYEGEHFAGIKVEKVLEEV